MLTLGGLRLPERSEHDTPIVGRRIVDDNSSKLTLHTECAKRWLHFLDPGLDYSEWTQQEDQFLIAEVKKIGRNWRRIVDEVLIGRSANDAKNRLVSEKSSVLIICQSGY